MPNPFAKGSQSLAAQSKLMARQPELAKAMKAEAENPWGYFFDVEEAKQKQEHRAAISYTADDHARNPYLKGSGGLKEQSELVKRDPGTGGDFQTRSRAGVIALRSGQPEHYAARSALYQRHPDFISGAKPLAKHASNGTTKGLRH